MRVICVTGNTATGTTTLTRRFNEVVGWSAVYSEDYIRRSPFFRRFLETPTRWAFHNQVFFFAEYAKWYRAVVSGEKDDHGIVCLDYSAYELLVYTEAMAACGFLDEAEHATLLSLFRVLEPTLRAPDLLIHVHAPVHVLIQRIKARGRPGESRIGVDYLRALQESFSRFMASWTRTPVLTIDSADVDFAHDDDVVRSIGAQALRQLAADAKGGFLVS